TAGTGCEGGRKAPDIDRAVLIARAVLFRHDGRIIRQNILNGLRLLILDRLVRVAGLAEWRIHDVFIAKHAKPAGPRDLPAGISRWQISRAGYYHRLQFR